MHIIQLINHLLLKLNYAYGIICTAYTSKEVERRNEVKKQDLINKVAEGVGLSKKEVATVFNCALDSIVAAVAAGEKVQFVGFGTFESKTRAARAGLNPQTGEAIQIAATTVPVFKAGKEFKDAVK